MPAPDFTAEITALQGAAASGELTIEQNGERVTYKNTADVLAAIAYFEGQAAKAATPVSSRSQFGFSAPAYDRT